MEAFGHYCPAIEFIVIVPWEQRVVCETCVKRVPIIWKRVESCVWTLRGPMCRCGGLFWGRGPELHGVPGPVPAHQYGALRGGGTLLAVSPGFLIHSGFLLPHCCELMRAGTSCHTPEEFSCLPHVPGSSSWSGDPPPEHQAASLPTETLPFQAWPYWFWGLLF